MDADGDERSEHAEPSDSEHVDTVPPPWVWPAVFEQVALDRKNHKEDADLEEPSSGADDIRFVVVVRVFVLTSPLAELLDARPQEPRKDCTDSCATHAVLLYCLCRCAYVMWKCGYVNR